MFRFHKTKDVITLFHKASVPASMRASALLKQISATASETATEDQTSDHTAHSKAQRVEFDLEVTEEPPTADQLKSILEYVGAQKASAIIRGAKDEADAIRKLAADGNSFERPVIVDWSNGKAIMGANESEILKMLEALPKN